MATFEITRNALSNTWLGHGITSFQLTRPWGHTGKPYMTTKVNNSDNFPAALYAELQEKGFLNFIRDPALGGFIQDSKYCRAAMHVWHYIVHKWRRYFEVLAIVEAIAGLQDFVVLRRCAGTIS